MLAREGDWKVPVRPIHLHKIKTRAIVLHTDLAPLYELPSILAESTIFLHCKRHSFWRHHVTISLPLAPPASSAVAPGIIAAAWSAVRAVTEYAVILIRIRPPLAAAFMSERPGRWLGERAGEV